MTNSSNSFKGQVCRGPSQEPGTRSSVSVFLQVPELSCASCFPNHISRKLDCKWSCWDSNKSSNMGCSLWFKTLAPFIIFSVTNQKLKENFCLYFYQRFPLASYKMVQRNILNDLKNTLTIMNTFNIFQLLGKMYSVFIIEICSGF